MADVRAACSVEKRVSPRAAPRVASKAVPAALAVFCAAARASRASSRQCLLSLGERHFCRLWTNRISQKKTPGNGFGY